MDTFGKVVTQTRGPVEMVLILLILVDYAPTEVLGATLDAQVKGVLGPFLNPVKSIMNHLVVRLFLWLLLLWACCKSKDMNLFFLIAIYFVVSNK